MPDAPPQVEPHARLVARSPGRRPLGRALAGAAAGLAVGGAAPLAARLAALPPEPFPDSVNILVAGPQDGRMCRWGDAITRTLGQSLPSGTRLRQISVGGPDGVTAANRFDARVAPDGTTVLLLPGAAALAWLTGDPRARFDAAHWLPVMAGLTSGVLASRVPAAVLRRGARLRVAASSSCGPELAALLGLDLMGIEPMPSTGLCDAGAALQALHNRTVDAVFANGPNAAAVLAAAATAGAMPLFTLGIPAEAGILRDPLLPEVPTVPELAIALRGAVPVGPLAGAWRAVAAAARLEFALVLPPLTPAAMVAQWRRAGSGASQALQSAATGVRLVGAPEANVATAAVAADPAAMIDLRHWLATRVNWTPS